MTGFARILVVALLVAIVFITFTNFVFFFPWYMTLVYETFNLSQAAAYDNYVKQYYYDSTLDRLKHKPIFKEKAEDIRISAVVGDNDHTSYYTAADKPYKQRGVPVTVLIRAVYPIRITIGGHVLESNIPVSFSLTTTGLRYYKDLDFEGDIEEMLE